MQPYERFAAWRHCHRLVLTIYDNTRHWPDWERYGLVAQIRRAAVSAAANLVEGAARQGSREFRRFLDIANGSLAELSYLLLVGRDLGYLTDQVWERLERQRTEAARTLWGLYGAVARHAKGG